MFNRLRSSAAIALVFFTAAGPARPWGSTGHRIVALIAEQRLSPGVRDKIRKLLMDGKYTLADISTCPDQLRGTGRSFGNLDNEVCQALAGPVPATAGTWHYIDIPVPSPKKALDAFCPDNNCVVARIKSFSDILRTSTDEAQRRSALQFVVHFMGDVHQPLHCAERGCDRGGNLEHVNFLLNGEKRANHALHFVWDIDLVDKVMADAKMKDENAFAAALTAAVKPGKAKKWARASVEDIAWEGHALAQKKA